MITNDLMFSVGRMLGREEKVQKLTSVIIKD